MRISNTSSKTNFTRAGILGLGLIGGSWARALKQRGVRVVASDESKSSVAAHDAGVVDELVKSPQGFEGCDVLLLCSPPTVVCETLPKLTGLNIGLVTDVCSVKESIMAAAQCLTNFIGGHPMAGSHTSGFAASNANLFANAPYILCVPENCALPHQRITAFEKLLADMNANILHMTPEEHDKSVATVSHLPHAAAFALARVALAQPGALRMAGRGFADTTRIADSSPALWTDILMSSPHLLPTFSQYISELSELSNLLSRRDATAIEKFLSAGPVCRAELRGAK